MEASRRWSRRKRSAGGRDITGDWASASVVARCAAAAAAFMLRFVVAES